MQHQQGRVKPPKANKSQHSGAEQWFFKGDNSSFDLDFAFQTVSPVPEETFYTYYAYFQLWELEVG